MEDEHHLSALAKLDAYVRGDTTVVLREAELFPVDPEQTNDLGFCLFQVVCSAVRGTVCGGRLAGADPEAPDELAAKWRWVEVRKVPMTRSDAASFCLAQKLLEVTGLPSVRCIAVQMHADPARRAQTGFGTRLSDYDAHFDSFVLMELLHRRHPDYPQYATLPRVPYKSAASTAWAPLAPWVVDHKALRSYVRPMEIKTPGMEIPSALALLWRFVMGFRDWAARNFVCITGTTQIFQVDADDFSIWTQLPMGRYLRDRDRRRALQRCLDLAQTAPALRGWRERLASDATHAAMSNASFTPVWKENTYTTPRVLRSLLLLRLDWLLEYVDVAQQSLDVVEIPNKEARVKAERRILSQFDAFCLKRSAASAAEGLFLPSLEANYKPTKCSASGPRPKRKRSDTKTSSPRKRLKKGEDDS